MMSKFVGLLVEGETDEIVLRRIVQLFPELSISDCYGKRGKGYIEEKIAGFNTGTTESFPLICLVDLDNVNCPSELIQQLIPGARNQALVIRVAVKEVEAWLLADRANLAKFIGSPENKVPDHPETCTDPKSEIINLAKRYGKSKEIKEIAPDNAKFARLGKGYVTQIARFVNEFWDIDIARLNSPSLNKAILAIEKLATSS